MAVLNNLKEWFLSLSRIARTGLIAGACVIVIAFISLSYWALSTDYQVLFSDLDPQDGSAIVTELDRMKVPYLFEDGGKTILVEKSQVYKTRLKLMGKGVNLKGTVGFEIFNESDFGMTDFAQRINYQRALQGELTRTIMGLEEVQSARVHLVVPESGFLKKGDKQTKASITVTPKPGYTLTQEQVLGIQRLVAAAVPEIEASAVTILDNRGVALTKAIDKDQEGTTGFENRLTVKQQTEEYFTKKIASILDKTFGPGKAIVSVDVTMNHDSLKVTREDVMPAISRNGDPDGAVSRRKMSSKRSKKAKKAAAAQADTVDDNGDPVEVTTEEIEYTHGKKIEQSVSGPGSIKRISVGVIIPNNIDPERIEMLSKVISMSAGLSVARGDALAVYPLDRFSNRENADQETMSRAKIQSFSKGGTPTENSHNTATNAQAAKNVSPYFIGSIVMSLALLLGLVWVIGRRRSSTQRMSDIQREQMLKEIQMWLAQPATPATTRNL
jgi:flagellar M-ring protein FliF